MLNNVRFGCVSAENVCFAYPLGCAKTPSSRIISTGKLSMPSMWLFYSFLHKYRSRYATIVKAYLQGLSTAGGPAKKVSDINFLIGYDKINQAQKYYDMMRKPQGYQVGRIRNLGKIKGTIKRGL